MFATDCVNRFGRSCSRSVAARFPGTRGQYAKGVTVLEAAAISFIVVFLVLVILFIQRRPSGLFATKGRYAES